MLSPSSASSPTLVLETPSATSTMSRPTSATGRHPQLVPPFQICHWGKVHVSLGCVVTHHLPPCPAVTVFSPMLSQGPSGTLDLRPPLAQVPGLPDAYYTHLPLWASTHTSPTRGKSCQSLLLALSQPSLGAVWSLVLSTSLSCPNYQAPNLSFLSLLAS